MKKTTTRLATIAAVLVMSAFAIALAQHDARKRVNQTDPLAIPGSDHGPAEPIDGNLMWPGKNPIVRGNNGEVSPHGQYSHNQVVSDHPSGYNPLRNEPQSDEDEFSESELPNDAIAFESGNVPIEPGFMTGQPDEVVAGSSEASVSEEQAVRDWETTGQLASFEASLTDGNVIQASGEQPALPSWLPNGDTPNASPNPPSFTENSLPQHSSPVATLSAPQPVASSPSSDRGLLPMAGSATTNIQSQSATNSTATPTIPPQNLPLPGNILPGHSSTGPALPANPLAGRSAPDQHVQGSFTSGASGGQSLQAMTPATSDRALGGSPRTALVSNQPGSRFLDGSQNPIMQIQKQAPEEIQVGKKVTFVITVRNAGNATAHEVTVVDRVPRGARFIEANPAISPTADGLLAWSLGEMAAGDERTISLQLVPEVEGEVGSVASVHFAAQASVRTVATLPQLVLQVDSIAPVIIGQAQQLVVNIQNNGSGVARAVRLEADVPAQLRHESGETQLEAFVGDLRPSESRRLVLAVAAIQAGQSQCVLRAVNDDGTHAEQAVAIEVRAPQLSAEITGPNLRYLERQASYQVMVSNVGTAAARNLDFVVHLPVGLKFISADIPQANYDPQSHSVALGLAELDSGQSAPFTINVLPVQLGAQVIRFNGTGDLNIATEAKTQVTVAGLAELSFTIGQDNGTVEVGANTTYSVQVSNIGNQPDKNVQLVVQLPEGTQLIQVDAPVEYQFDGGKIVFSPVSEMRNRDVKTYRFQIQHNRAGNQVVRSQLTSENWPVAVVKEEGTLVYNDRN